MELKNLKTFEQMFENEMIDEKFLSSLRDKILGVKKVDLNDMDPSEEAKKFSERKIKSISEYLNKIGIPTSLTAAAMMALYDYADGIPLLGKLKVEYDKKENTITITPRNDKSFAGDIVMG